MQYGVPVLLQMVFTIRITCFNVCSAVTLFFVLRALLEFWHLQAYSFLLLAQWKQVKMCQRSLYCFHSLHSALVSPVCMDSRSFCTNFMKKEKHLFFIWLFQELIIHTPGTKLPVVHPTFKENITYLSCTRPAGSAPLAHPFSQTSFSNSSS